MTAQILVIDDDPHLCRLLAHQIGDDETSVRWETSPRTALDSLFGSPVDVIVTDVEMPEMDGIQLCERVAETHPGVPVIILTRHGDMETALRAMRAGAADFLSKPPSAEALRSAIDRTLKHRTLCARLEESARPAQPVSIDGLVGRSDAMSVAAELIDRIRDTSASVLVTGESGTGKEVVARALHANSRRRQGPFVAVNCAAIPEPLLESELFGHVRGAFTDARVARAGLFVQANGGTLFLDEIADLPFSMQSKLLRVLQEKRVRAVGADADVAIDVRIVAATNSDLEEAVKERRFRQDLFFRLNVIRLPLPALRERGDDVLLLAHHFLRQCAARLEKRVVRFSPAAAERLLGYAWPGNVRELENCVERAATLARHDEVVVDDLPDALQNARTSGRTLVRSMTPLDELERAHILHVLDAVAGNRTQCATILGIDRKTLQRKLKRYDARE